MTSQFHTGVAPLRHRSAIRQIERVGIETERDEMAVVDSYFPRAHGEGVVRDECCVVLKVISSHFDSPRCFNHLVIPLPGSPSSMSVVIIEDITLTSGSGCTLTVWFSIVRIHSDRVWFAYLAAVSHLLFSAGLTRSTIMA